MSDQPHHPSCGPEPHLHTLVFPAAAGPGACVIMLASRDGDFVMDLEQAIKIAAGEIPAPGYGPTVYSTEVPSEAPLE